MVSHVERRLPEREDGPVVVATMWCGAQLVVFDDLGVVPEGHDFYAPEQADRANCEVCVDAIEAAASLLREDAGA